MLDKTVLDAASAEGQRVGQAAAQLPWSSNRAVGECWQFAVSYADARANGLYQTDIEAIRQAFFTSAREAFLARYVEPELPAPSREVAPSPAREPVPAIVPALNPAPVQAMPLAISLKEETEND